MDSGRQRAATDLQDIKPGASVGAAKEQQAACLLVAKTLNNELRSQFLRNKRRIAESNVMQPPHLTVSVNAKRESEKEYILKMAQRCNHLTENLVEKEATAALRKDKRKSESLAASSRRGEGIQATPGSSAADTTLDTIGAARFKHHDVGFRGLELDDDLKMGKRSFNVNSITRRLAKYEAADQNLQNSSAQFHINSTINKKRYDLVTGKPKVGYDGSFS